MFILYASFLDFFLERIWGSFFWIGWGFALSAIFFFCAMFLVGGRSFPFWLLFIRYWVSLVSYTWGFFYERCFFYAFVMGGSFFSSFFFHLSFICCHLAPPTHDQEVGEGR